MARWASMIMLLLLAGNTQAQGEGVHVHGHWKLEIYNADGSFDRLVEFDNALTSLGASKLVHILARGGSVDKWQVNIQRPVGVSIEDPCTDSQGIAFTCVLQEGPAGTTDGYRFGGLSVSTDDPNNPTKLILSGSFVVGAIVGFPKEIGTVKSHMSLCDAASTPNCNGPPQLFEFTAKELATSVPVQPGQSVQVTVEISFS